MLTTFKFSVIPPEWYFYTNIVLNRGMQKLITMNKTKKVDLDYYFKGFGNLLGQVESPLFTEHLFEFLTPVLNAQNFFLLIIEKEREPICIDSWIPQEKLKRVYDEYYFKFGYLLDPFYELALSPFEDGAFLIRDIAPDNFFSQSEYYLKYFNKTEMIDEMSCVASIDEQKSVHLSIGRYEGCPKFRKKELALLQSLGSLLIPLLVKHCEYRLKQQDRGVEHQHVSLKDQFYNANFPKDGHMTKREAEIASLIIKGYSTVAIGLKLFISPQTVKVHRRNIYRKLNISSQAELFSFFVNISK